MDVIATPVLKSISPLWLGLVLTPGLGHRGLHHLYTSLGAADAIYAASLTTLESCGIASAAAQSIHDGRSARLGAEEAERVAAANFSLVTLDDRAYPELLREIYDPPPVLYVRGALDALDTFGIAVVGTRHPSVYGRIMAERLGSELAQWGLTVFSGLARGVDAVSQAACAAARGRTVAVLGSGVDVIYPGENRKLADAILDAGGAIVSEFPLGTTPAPQNFPVRNRVISGLSLGVLVIEGGEYSGSRITARMALEQGREVFGVPGMATQSQAWLPNSLIRQGAKLVTTVCDIVEELPSAARIRLTPPPEPVTVSDAASGVPVASLSAARNSVLAALAVDTPRQIDEIVNLLQNKVSAPEVLTHLLELELAGQVRVLPGKNFLRVS